MPQPSQFSLKVKDYFITFRSLVVLSPHPDDVVCSLGGCVYQLPRSLHRTVLTVFSRSKYAPGFPRLTNESDISRVRGEEEDRYVNSIGATSVRLDFVDASVLGHSADSEITDNFVDDRFDAVCLLIDRVLVDLVPDLILAPLALGRHIDHRIVFEAIHRIPYTRRATVLYYEDLPYAGLLSESEVLEQVTARLGRSVISTVIDITPTITKKCNALALYPSQIIARHEPVIINHARRIYPGGYAERLWRRES